MSRPIRHARSPLALALLALFWAGAARAENAPPDEARILAGPCAACHGPDGVSPAEIPSIAGQSREDLVAKLTAFRDAPPAGTTVMDRHMRGYDDAQIALLAAYFAGVEQ